MAKGDSAGTDTHICYIRVLYTRKNFEKVRLCRCCHAIYGAMRALPTLVSGILNFIQVTYAPNSIFDGNCELLIMNSKIKKEFWSYYYHLIEDFVNITSDLNNSLTWPVLKLITTP